MSSVTETINAGTWREFFEPGDFFRLLETTAPVTVEFYAAGRKIVDVVNIQAGYAEYFRGGTLVMFDRVRIYSATTQQVGFVTRFGSDVRYDRGASSVTGTVALDAATLAALKQINIRPEPGQFAYSSFGSMGANTAVAVFTAAANISGAIVQLAGANEYIASAGAMSLVSKATTPASIGDGEVLAIGKLGGINGSSIPLTLELQSATYVPAGHGLYFITSVGTTSGYAGRYARGKFL
jgi:hypothetical protein